MKRTRKVLSLVLTLALVFGLSATAFAADPQPYSSSTDTSFSITVTGAADGETYNAYKIFDVTYDDAQENYSYTIDSDSAWYSTVAAATDVFTLTQVNGTSTYLVTVNAGVEDDAIIAIFTTAGVPEGATAAATTTAGGNTAVLNVTSSGPGYYYVTTSLGSLVIIDTTNPTPEIEEKNGIPTVEKWVHENSAANNTWQHEDDASNTESILFEINISSINGAVNLVLHDSMDSELHLADETEFHLNSIVLYTSENDTTGTVLTEAEYDAATETWVNGDFYLTVGACTVDNCTLNNCAFEVHFLRDFDDVDATGYITLTYYLVLDTEGEEYENDFDEIDNYAQVTFATSSYSAPVQAETYSFGFEVYKYTGAYGSDVEIIFENVYYDFNAGEDAYIVSCDDENGNRWYAVFENTTCNENGWQNATFVITDWVEDENQATHILEPTDISTVGDESGYYTWEFYYAGTMSAQSEVHVREIETNGDDGITVLDEIDEAIVSFGTGGPLAGAVFEVTDASGQTAYFLYEENLGIYLFEGWLAEDETVPEGYTTSVTSSSEGMIYIEGLDTGDYILTEIVAPDGYNLLTSSIYVTIWAQYNNDTGECLDHGVTWTLGEDGDEESGVVYVENNSGTELPGTGGIGTTWFYIIGAILVCGAVVVLVTRRRVNAKAA